MVCVYFFAADTAIRLYHHSDFSVRGFPIIASFISRVQQKSRKNLGIVVDIGHSLIVDENPAEALALAAHYGKLFHVHLNDNYRNVDDDLMVGAIHFWETLEFFYEMDMVGYDGWLNLDIWPSYIDGPAALRESIKRVRMFENLVENLPREEIRSLQRKGDLVKAMEIVRKTCIKEY